MLDASEHHGVPVWSLVPVRGLRTAYARMSHMPTGWPLHAHIHMIVNIVCVLAAFLFLPFFTVCFHEYESPNMPTLCHTTTCCLWVSRQSWYAERAIPKVRQRERQCAPRGQANHREVLHIMVVIDGTRLARANKWRAHCHEDDHHRDRNDPRHAHLVVQGRRTTPPCALRGRPERRVRRVVRNPRLSAVVSEVIQSRPAVTGVAGLHGTKTTPRHKVSLFNMG